MKDKTKRNLSLISLILAVVLAIIFVASIYKYPNPEICNRLEPCCYGQGKPDFILHLADPPTWKYWEFIDRDNDNRSLYQLWHYRENSTTLFFDNETDITITALSLGALKVYVNENNDEGLISRDGYCWFDRMVDYLG